jgi:hypothetical protein
MQKAADRLEMLEQLTINKYHFNVIVTDTKKENDLIVHFVDVINCSIYR